MYTPTHVRDLADTLTDERGLHYETLGRLDAWLILLGNRQTVARPVGALFQCYDATIGTDIIVGLEFGHTLNAWAMDLRGRRVWGSRTRRVVATLSLGEMREGA